MKYYYFLILLLYVGMQSIQAKRSCNKTNQPQKTNQPKNTSNIIEITSIKQLEQQKERAFANNKMVVLDIYMTNCHGCEILAPIFKQEAANRKDEAIFLKANSDNPNFDELVGKYAQKGFPTLVFFKPQQSPLVKTYVYTSVESLDKVFVEAQENKEKKPTPQAKAPVKKEIKATNIKEITSQAEFDALLEKGKKENKIVVIKLYTSWCGACKMYNPAFEAVAQKLEDKVIFATANLEEESLKSLKKYAEAYPTTAAFKPEVKKSELKVGSLSEGMLERWIVNQMNENVQMEAQENKEKKPTPKIKEPVKKEIEETNEINIKEIMSQEDFDALLEKGKKENKVVVIKLYTSWCGACTMYQPAFEAVAQKLAGKVIFAKANLEKESLKSLKKYTEAYPTTAVFKPEVKKPVLKVGTLSREMLERWISHQMNENV
ncbi:MAG: thioredoxin domain-containing protein [Candidatus Babeliaceae bacterium]